MKNINEDFAARLAGGVTTTCLCWRLERRDGLTVCVCDHDHPLRFMGHDYMPGASLDAARFETAGGLRPGRASADGALSAEAITEEDLEAGLWVRARVHVHRVDWRHPEDGILLWTGFLSEIVRNGAHFEAELISLKAELERPVGRVLARRCDAVLGDARCGLSGVEAQSCDKRFETCSGVFGNGVNFRGFPHMPGQDFILAGPATDGNDGGRR
tara:strand:- start:225 stop:866 length:642 start_codon:yes stop_codon:yes gene_type:complete